MGLKLTNQQERIISSNEIENALNSIGIETSNDVQELIKENKVIQNRPDTQVEKHDKLDIINSYDRELAVKRNLVPEKYKDASFDKNKIKTNIASQYIKSKEIYKVHNFYKYLEVCSEILSTIRSGVIPRRSWIIGAPNGFGKSSFVNECLITMLKRNWVVAPYISLHELAEIRVEEEQRLMKPFSYKATQGIYEKDGNQYFYNEYNYSNGIKSEDIIKKPTIITSNYSWSEYINAKCLFVHFTDVVSKDLESHVLYQLLSIRGAKGLPTIVMMSTSLEPYIKDTNLRELVWDEIIEDNKNKDSYDKLVHVSCYKVKNFGISKNENIEKETGIVD